MRWLESYDDRDDALAARDRHAETLRRLGRTPELTVSVERQGGAWAVLLHHADDAEMASWLDQVHVQCIA